MNVSDIELREGAAHIVHERKYDNLKCGESDVNGFGWQLNKLPKTSYWGSFYRAEFASNDSVHFNLTPDDQGVHQAHFDYPDTLKIDADAKTFLVTRNDGTVWTFNNDPEGTVSQGLPISAVDKNGKMTEFIYQDQHLVQVKVTQKDQILAELEYAYNSEGLLVSISLRESSNNVLKPVKRVLYSYYSDENSCGNSGDLKSVITEMAINDSWVTMATCHYRYYKVGEINGPKHAMKMAFFPADFELFTQKSGNICCCSISDSEALDFATKYYEYDDKQRVILERVDRNRKLITMEYTEYPDSDDQNAVHRKTVETGPFGNKNIVFTNKNGKVLLREEVAPSENGETSAIYHFRYNVEGKQTHRYSAGVVLGYTVVAGQKSALELDFSPDKGMIEIREFHANDQDGPKNAFFRKTIQNGTKGTPIVQDEVQYEKFDVNGKTKWKTKQDIQFADEEAKSPIATSYKYELFPGTDKVMQKTTILPVIPKEQNGTGIAATIVERFDEKGRLIWSKDEVGVIRYNQYDSTTGRLVKSIMDVDTTKTADFDCEVPKGWATIADAGKHLATEYEYDAQGRMAQVLYPENESVDENNNAIVARKASWTVYDEVHRQTMYASGYVTADQKAVLVNPVSITIRNVAGNVQEEILAARDKAEGRLLVTDAFPQSSYVSWTKYLYEGSNLVATRVYTTIPLTGDGVHGKNYGETVFQYDAFGRQNQTIAPNGLITKQKLNWHGHALEIWQGANESDLVLMTEMIYGGEGGCPTCSGQGAKPRIVVQHVDGEKTRITENVYDWRGRPIETFGEEDANGQSLSTRRHYDNIGRIVKTEQFVNDALESRFIAGSETCYTPQGQVWCQSKSAVDPKTGEVVETAKSLVWLDAKGRQVKSQSACQCLTNVTNYDSLGRSVCSAVLNKNNEVIQETEQVYDNAGNAIATVMTELSATSKKDFSRKQFTSAWFDPMGRSVANAQFGTNGGKAFQREKKVPDSGLITRQIYDTKTGLDAAQIDAAGRTTTFAYDATRRRVKESLFKPEDKNIKGKASGHKLVRETRSQADMLRGVGTQTDSLGNTMQIIVDAYGRTIAQIDTLGNRTEMVYNRIGELLEQKDTMGRVTRFVYDALGRRVEMIFPKLSPTEKNPVRKTVYNALGQVVQEIDPLGHVTTIEYDAFGRRAAVIDAEGGRTEFAYDFSGKLLSLKDPVGNVTSYVYDEERRVLEETNAFGKSRKFEYEGRLPVRKTDRNGRVIEFKYNDFGRPTVEKWFDTEGKLVETIAYQFDLLGKMTQVADSSGVQTFEHDELDRIAQTVMQLAGLEKPVTLANQFDEMNRRTRIMAKIGETVDFVNRYEYDTQDRVIGILQNEKQVSYSYNAAGQRTSTSVFTGSNKVFDTLYNYDGMGRLTDLAHTNGEKVFADYDFGWDIANRITGFDFSYLGEKEEKAAEYGYDKTSQLVSADYNAFQTNELYAYDANGNRISEKFENSANNQLTSDGKFRYNYDDEGNRIEKTSIASAEVTKYIWDHRNRLVKVVMPRETVAYVYDFQNRMTRRNDEFIVHDGWQIILTLDAKGKAKDRNLWGANQDELIATNDQFTLCDHLGSVRDIVNADGKVTGHREYNAFGKVIRSTGKAECAFGYTGKLFDNKTQLQWNINRWYDAEIGRWCNNDPLGFQAWDTNLYRYVFNCSVALNDPFGLITKNFGDYVKPVYDLVQNTPLKKIGVIQNLVNGLLNLTSILDAIFAPGNNPSTADFGSYSVTKSCFTCPNNARGTQYIVSVNNVSKSFVLPELQYNLDKGTGIPGLVGYDVQLKASLRSSVSFAIDGNMTIKKCPLLIGNNYSSSGTISGSGTLNVNADVLALFQGQLFYYTFGIVATSKMSLALGLILSTNFNSNSFGGGKLDLEVWSNGSAEIEASAYPYTYNSQTNTYQQGNPFVYFRYTLGTPNHNVKLGSIGIGYLC